MAPEETNLRLRAACKTQVSLEFALDTWGIEDAGEVMPTEPRTAQAVEASGTVADLDGVPILLEVLIENTLRGNTGS